jgi:hypothetical protein
MRTPAGIFSGTGALLENRIPHNTPSYYLGSKTDMSDMLLFERFL